MNCSAPSLAAEAKCLSCITRSALASVRTFLLCQYANGTSPPVPQSTLLDGIVAYFGIPVSDDGQSSTAAYGESRTVVADPFSGIVNPVVSAGVGHSAMNLSHTVLALTAGGAISGAGYTCPTVTTSVGNGRVTWGGWASSGDVIIIQHRSVGGTRWWRRVPAATVASGWVDDALGWTDASASSPADFPDVIKRLWYYAVSPSTASTHPSAMTLTQGAFEPNSSVFLNMNPYLFLQPG